ncbi:hypothetical protein I307_05514 [Cryptococcus deuterogattii 99/473]|uniref:Uncharacterized protein n=1 Tax=Cryptococcus deuterogattii Ram5 TaxID=1296110 RepID=A0A0D0SZ09_9TREE|nr:hypothetical protein I309_03659 [Cryptococcus deuterogattii LA55]KIR32220.1 hypothetical protein I352_05453 [Cryptococcus deuterogattii MMRL2647]KIR38482.1 hypothetical protein I313_05593 [Cryptococcus deuterogattii Ram5]KIR70469.1 hypothetical protein I310_05718 [Cryptococcus deuterogattii CA1014]KIR90326.1 hypothetical protein I304_05903 [Cryptococcus deuterogattii CBS 10090]KIR97014.1 hypothetical protein L804_05673 [Cryptococcus deuterogattii 2001/935-1]KIY55102.1 hypothetical protein 
MPVLPRLRLPTVLVFSVLTNLKRSPRTSSSNSFLSCGTLSPGLWRVLPSSPSPFLTVVVLPLTGKISSVSSFFFLLTPLLVSLRSVTLVTLSRLLWTLLLPRLGSSETANGRRLSLPSLFLETLLLSSTVTSAPLTVDWLRPLMFLWTKLLLLASLFPSASTRVTSVSPVPPVSKVRLRVLSLPPVPTLSSVVLPLLSVRTTTKSVTCSRFLPVSVLSVLSPSVSSSSSRS